MRFSRFVAATLCTAALSGSGLAQEPAPAQPPQPHAAQQQAAAPSATPDGERRIASVQWMDFIIDPQSIEVKTGVLARGDAVMRMRVRHAVTGVLLDDGAANALLTSDYHISAGQTAYRQTFQRSSPYYASGQPREAWCIPSSTTGMFGDYSVAVCLFDNGDGTANYVPSSAGMSSPYYATKLMAGGPRGPMPRIEQRQAEFDRPLYVVLSYIETDRRDFDFGLYFLAERHSGTNLGRLAPSRGEDGAAELAFLGARFRVTPGANRREVSIEQISAPFAELRPCPSGTSC